MEREIIILTRSSKKSNFCVAGVDAYTGEWIRLVSNDQQSHGALSRNDIRCTNGGLCQPLDIVRVDVIGAAPLELQPENYLINRRMRWNKIGEWTIEDVINVHPAENNRYLYGDVYPYVSEQNISDIGYSLTLVYVSSLTITQVSSTFDGVTKVKTKASFYYNGRKYNNMSVTDPDYYSIPDGTYYREAYLVVSLPDAPFPEGCYYKFVARIYPV